MTSVTSRLAEFATLTLSGKLPTTIIMMITSESGLDIS